MRLQHLSFPAFGPFTDLRLTFPTSPAGHDLQVIYGENEAGKSSLLRAIRDLLFGIPSRSVDNFRHDYKNLRLQGEIANRSGDRLTFQRRKGNQNTLLDEAGNALPDTALLPYLGLVDLDYFSAMFGLGSTELHEGARQLLKGEGDLGKALFSASMGGTPIQKVIEALEEESSRLFKGRTSANVSIRPAVKRYKELITMSRDAMVQADAWDRIEASLREKEAERTALEETVATLDSDLEWILRVEDALPTIGKLNEELRQWRELPELPDVASDFVARARSVSEALSASSRREDELTQQVARLEDELAACVIPAEILARSEALEGIHQELGAHRTNKERRLALGNKLERMEAELHTGMKNLELTGELATLESLRLGSAARMGCEEAAEALRTAQTAHDANDADGETARQEIRNREEALQKLPETDLQPLRDALAMAAQASDANATLSTSRAEVERLRIQVADRHALVVGAPADPDEAARLAVPQAGTLRRFRERFTDNQREIEGVGKRIAEGEAGLQGLRDDLARLQQQGSLPSADLLTRTRKHRDLGWECVLAEWKGQGEKREFVPGVPLEQAYPDAVTAADQVADQMRSRADAVARAGDLRLQIARSEAQLAKQREELAALQSEREKCEGEWAAEWAACGITPRPPAEMEEWRDVWLHFREALTALREAGQAAHARAEQVEEARNLLAAVLDGGADKEFSVLFEAARARVQEGEELTGRRQVLSEELQKQRHLSTAADARATELARALQAARENWQARCREIGLPEDTTPDTGLKLLLERRNLLAEFDRWQDATTECEQFAKAVHDYEQAVRDHAAPLGIEADTTEGMEARLWRALSGARETQTRHHSLAEQLQSHRNALATARQATAQATEALEDLLRLAGLPTAEQLEPLLANLESRDSLKKRIADFRLTLGGLARGQSVDDFIARIQAEDADALPGKRLRLQNEKADKQAVLQVALTGLADLQSQKRAMEKAGDEAADFRQQAETIAAKLREDADRFVQLRLAVHILQQQIESFRKRNQGPLLEKSGEIFRAITRGAFDGLAPDFDAADVPVLMGRRGDGSLVPVEGMSDGSRDQLYLALRLAALDRYLQEHEPMPLILDDLLITFDDERTRAILPQLAEFSRRTQILLFTHHEHLVELCRNTLGNDRFHLHRLQPPATQGNP